MDLKKNYTQYEPAAAELVLFDNNDVVVTSDSENGGCKTWSNQTGNSCYYGLTE